MSGEVIDLMTHPKTINREIGKNYRRNLLERVNGQFDSQLAIMKASTQRAGELADRIDDMCAKLAAGDETILCGHAQIITTASVLDGYRAVHHCTTCGKRVEV